MLRLTWDNGDRTVLVNAELGGATFGWKLTHTAHDELFAAMEGTGFHTRVILERMEQHGVRIDRVINGGGIPNRNAKLNQIYADILNKPVLVPQGDVTSLGAAIFAFLACGAFKNIEAGAGRACVLSSESFEPNPASVTGVSAVVSFISGSSISRSAKNESAAANIGDVMPEIRRIGAEVRNSQ